MDRIKKGLSIFAFFFKIGCFTFGGGWAILAQMEQEFVDKRQIITKSELLEMVAVGKLRRPLRGVWHHSAGGHHFVHRHTVLQFIQR